MRETGGTILQQLKALGAAAQQRFGVPVGHYHTRPVGPHPRGSCQLTVPPETGLTEVIVSVSPASGSDT